MLIIYAKVTIMMVMMVKDIKIRLIGIVIEKIVYIEFKTTHMIDRGQIQSNIGIHQITSINLTLVMPMMVTVLEIKISIGLKSSVRIGNGKIIGINYLAMEIQKNITANLAKLKIHMI